MAIACTFKNKLHLHENIFAHHIYAWIAPYLNKLEADILSFLSFFSEKNLPIQKRMTFVKRRPVLDVRMCQLIFFVWLFYIAYRTLYLARRGLVRTDNTGV